MARFYVQMFGKLCIHRGQEVCVSLDSRKALELFCYLLLYPKHPLKRGNSRRRDIRGRYSGADRLCAV